MYKFTMLYPNTLLIDLRLPCYPGQNSSSEGQHVDSRLLISGLSLAQTCMHEEPNIRAYMCVHMDVGVGGCVCVCSRFCQRNFAYVYVYVYIYIYMYVCMYMCTHAPGWISCIRDPTPAPPANFLQVISLVQLTEALSDAVLRHQHLHRSC